MNNHELDNAKEILNSIKVPAEALDLTIQSAMKKGKKEKTRAKRKRHYLSAAAVLLSVTIGSGFVSPAMAKVLSNVPLLESVFGFVGDKGLKIAQDEGLSDTVNQSISDENITLTIKEVIYDETRLSVGYVVQAPDGNLSLDFPEITIDGNSLNYAGGLTGDYISEQEYAGVMNVEAGEQGLPNSFTMGLAFYQIGKVEGKWEFEFPVKRSKSDVKTVLVNESKEYKDRKITLKSLHSGPAGVKLLVQTEAPSGVSPEAIGDRVIGYRILNDKGQTLTASGGSGSGEEINGRSIMDFEYTFYPPEQPSDYLVIQPYLHEKPGTEMPHEVSAPLDEEVLPLTLEDPRGKITVTDIKHENDKTLLIFNVESELPLDDYLSFSHTIEVEDNLNRNYLSSPPKQIKQNQYVQEMKRLNKSANPQIKVRFFPELETIKELEFKVPLK